MVSSLFERFIAQTNMGFLPCEKFISLTNMGFLLLRKIYFNQICLFKGNNYFVCPREINQYLLLDCMAEMSEFTDQHRGVKTPILDYRMGIT